nr:unnamed protein product [Naegleria fowleri]
MTRWIVAQRNSLFTLFLPLLTLVSYTLAFDILSRRPPHNREHQYTLDELAPSPYYSKTSYLIPSYIVTNVTISYGHFDVLAIGEVGSMFEVYACSTNAWTISCSQLATSVSSKAYRQQFYNEKNVPLFIVFRNTDSTQNALIKELFVNRVSEQRFMDNVFSLTIPLNADHFFQVKDLLQSSNRICNMTITPNIFDATVPFTLQLDAGFNQNQTVEQTQKLSLKTLSESSSFMYKQRCCLSDHTLNLIQYDEAPPLNQTILGAILGGTLLFVGFIVIVIFVVIVCVCCYCCCTVIPNRRFLKEIESKKRNQRIQEHYPHTSLHLLSEHDKHEQDEMNHLRAEKACPHRDLSQTDPSLPIKVDSLETGNSFMKVNNQKEQSQTPNKQNSQENASDFPVDTVIDSFESMRIRTSQQPLLPNSVDTKSQSNNNSTASKSSQNHNQDSNMFNGRYKCIRKIGEGSFGKCYLCEDTKRENMQVAIKLIPVNENDLGNFLKECSKMIGINHKNLVKVYEFFHEKVKLFEIIKPKNNFVEEFDPERNQIEVILGDYGESKYLFECGSNSPLKGTMGYMAPEVFSYLQYGTATDVFSLGVTLYQVVCGSGKISTIVASLMLNEIKMMEEISNNLKDKGVDQKIADFILSMLCVNPEQRPSVLAIKNFGKRV